MAIGKYSHSKLMSLIRQQASAQQGGGTGDVTSVTAGNGLSGGGASGDVTLDVDIVGATDGTGITVSTTDLILLADVNDSNNVKRIQINQLPSTSTNPAGSDTQIQFNDNGSFGASANVAYNGSILAVTGTVDFNGNLAVNMAGASPTHGITLPDSSTVTGQVKANAFLSYSSIRFKDNIQPLGSALDTISKLKGVSYNWKDTGKKDFGFIAEEVGKVLPEIVEWNTDPQYANTMDYTKIISFLVEAVKEQQEKIDLLSEKLDKIDV